MTTSRRLHLIAYDISDVKRGRTIFRRLKQLGTHRQLSVFLVRADLRKIQALASELSNIIKPDEDSILILPIDETAESRTLELGLKGANPDPRVLIL